MRSKLLSMGTAVMAASFVVAGFGVAEAKAQGNANKPGTMAPATTARKHHPRKHTESMAVPHSVSACLDKLSTYAAKEPLTPYENGPSQIINNGLMWNSPQSKCSVGADQATRDKVFSLATAWQMKDTGKVKSALDDLKASVPAAAAEPAATTHRKPRKRAATNKNKNAAT